MLIVTQTLEPWRGEPVEQETTFAEIVRMDGSREETRVEPYTHSVNLPANIEEKWTDDELNAVGLARWEAFQVPEGKQTVGDPTLKVVNGRIQEVYAVEDVPEPPPPLTKEERVARLCEDYGLTKEDLKEALDK